jgi:ribosomal subunit interface protein
VIVGGLDPLDRPATTAREGTVDSSVEIVVTGRDMAVPDQVEQHAVEKLSRLEFLDRHMIRYDVELIHEPSRRRSPAPYQVSITGHGRGPTVRAEANGVDLRSALDAAIGRVDSQLRRSHDRNEVHHYRQSPATEPDRG